MRAAWVVYRDVLDILPRSARRFLLFYASMLALLSALDGISLALLALAITPLVSGGSAQVPFFGTVTDGQLVWMLVAICVLLILKSIFALMLHWRATRRFAEYELILGSRLFDSYVNAGWLERLSRNSADIVRLTDGSVSIVVSGFLLPAATLLGEVVSFATVLGVLAVAQPLIAVVALVYLAGLGAFLFFGVTRRVRQAGLVALRYSLRSSRLITEMVGALKEVTLRGQTDAVAKVVRENRWHVTRARANAQFLGQVPRYALDAGLVGGFLLVAGVGFLAAGPTGAVTAVALFGLAGFRLAPSIIRFQGVVNQVSVSRPHAERILEEIRRSEAASAGRTSRDDVVLPERPKNLQFQDVSFAYRDGAPAVQNITLTIPLGSTIAFVGSSGAGKSTMVDLILGLLHPTSGTVSLDGISLDDVGNQWRARVGYVPQEVAIFDSTVAQNVALTWTSDFSPEQVRRALAQAQLLETIEGREGGINAPVGERGLALSGGQRQRIGIARALYPSPLVLVMDEATSALDTATEAAVSQAITDLKGAVTVIVVAHRLATVKHSDVIFFMKDGRVAAQGSFAHLVRTVPDFAAQANLAGLGLEP